MGRLVSSFIGLSMVIHRLGAFVQGIITGALFMDGFIYGHHWGIIMCFMGAVICFVGIVVCFMGIVLCFMGVICLCVSAFMGVLIWGASGKCILILAKLR